jgi:hypothetical protein
MTFIPNDNGNEDLLKEILIQLKIIKVHQEIVTNEEVTEDDVKKQ